MSETYKGQYAPELYDERKRYYLLQAQESESLTDAELRDLHLISNTNLRRFIQNQLGDNIAVKDGFKIVENPSDRSNNFLITGGDGSLDHPGTFYLRGYRLTLRNSISYKDQTSTRPITDDAYTMSSLSPLTTPSGTLADIYDIDLAGTSIIACGSDSTIVRTQDFGRNWVVTNTGTKDLKGISAADSSTIYASGLNGVVLKSTNGGELWSFIGPVSHPTTNFDGISFVNTSNGWVVGDNGVILKTTNGGSSWIPQGLGITSAYLHSVSAISGTGPAWAAGQDGTVVYTSDGINWSTQYTGVNKTLNRIQAVDSTYVYAVGLNGTVIKTIDGGITWSLLTLDSTMLGADLYGLYFLDRTSGWIVGANIISHTTDGGLSWTSKVVDSSANLRSIVFVDNTGFAVGLNGCIYRTLDGISWDKYRTDYVYLDFHLAEVSADSTMGSEYYDPALLDSSVGLPSANRLRAVSDIKVSEGWPMPPDYISDGSVQHYTALLATITRIVGQHNILESCITDARTVIRTICELDTSVSLGALSNIPDYSIGPSKLDSTADYIFGSVNVLRNASVLGNLKVDGDLTASNFSVSQNNLTVSKLLQVGSSTIPYDGTLQVNGRIVHYHNQNVPAYNMSISAASDAPVLNIISDGSGPVLRIERRSNSDRCLIDMTSVGTGYDFCINHTGVAGGVFRARDAGTIATINLKKDSVSGNVLDILTKSSSPTISINNDSTNGASFFVDQTTGVLVSLGSKDATSVLIDSLGSSRDIFIRHLGTRGVALDVTSNSIDGAINLYNTAGTAMIVRQNADYPVLNLVKDSTGIGQVVIVDNAGSGVGLAVLNRGSGVAQHISQTGDTTNPALWLYVDLVSKGTGIFIDNFGIRESILLRHNRVDSTASVIRIDNTSFGPDMSSRNWVIDQSGSLFTRGDITAAKYSFDNTHYVSSKSFRLDYANFDKSDSGLSGRAWTEMGLLRVSDGNVAPLIACVKDSTGTANSIVRFYDSSSLVKSSLSNPTENILNLGNYWRFNFDRSAFRLQWNDGTAWVDKGVW